MKLSKIFAFIIIASFFVAITACQKDEEKVTTTFRVTLTDNGTEKSTTGIDSLSVFDEINIEIEQVSIHYGDTSGNGNWVELPTNSGIYNLLELDSTTFLLANGGEFPAGHISQMRLLLGENNYVIVDSVAHDLKTPGAQQSGLKLNLDFDAEAGAVYEIYLDFDASESIVIQGNGGYLLKPVMRIDNVVEVGP